MENNKNIPDMKDQIMREISVKKIRMKSPLVVFTEKFTCKCAQYLVVILVILLLVFFAVYLFDR